MHAFEYHRPSSLADAAKLAGKGDDAKLLAGGQSLVQAMKLRLAVPSDLVELNAISEPRGLTADGKIRPCLLSDTEIDVKSPLRGGCDDRELERLLRLALAIKPERHYITKPGAGGSHRAMSRIGGGARHDQGRRTKDGQETHPFR